MASAPMFLPSRSGLLIREIVTWEQGPTLLSCDLTLTGYLPTALPPDDVTVINGPFVSLWLGEGGLG